MNNKSVDLDLFQEDIHSILIIPLTSYTDEFLKIYNDTLCHLAEKYALLQKTIVTVQPNPQWYTDEI